MAGSDKAPPRADFYFIATLRRQSKTDRRVDGFFVIPQISFSCRACSGSTKLSPLPVGRYSCKNFRERNTAAMTISGVGFSVDLSDKYDPSLKRMRTLLRIHPDGGKPGTEGCVGIRSQLKECHAHLKQLFAKPGTTRWMEVVVVPSRNDFILSTEHGTFIWA